jgi:hypothetical protein
MNSGQPVAFCFAAVFLGLTLWREILWRRRFHFWKRTEGVVKGFKSDGDGPSLPIVGYSAGDVHRVFESSFCLFNPSVGEFVTVLYDPDSDRAAIYTQRHRWFLSVLSGSFFGLLLWLAVLSH